MELVRWVYGDLGVKLPESHRGITTSDIPAMLEESPKYTQAMLVSACNAIGRRVATDELERYDLVLIWQAQTRTLFPAIYLGRDQVMTSAVTSGVTVIRFSRINRLVAAWRII